MKNFKDKEHQNKGHSHTKHMWLMAIFCGVPIIGFLVFGVFAISMPSLEILFLLICFIGMAGMMYLMHRDSHGKDKELISSQSEKGDDYETGK